MAQRVDALDDAVFGYWKDGARVPGLIEQNNAIIKSIKKRDDDFVLMVTEAWKLGRPIVALLAVLSFVGVLNLFFGPHGTDTAIKAIQAIHGG